MIISNSSENEASFEEEFHLNGFLWSSAFDGDNNEEEDMRNGP